MRQRPQDPPHLRRRRVQRRHLRLFPRQTERPHAMRPRHRRQQPHHPPPPPRKRPNGTRRRSDFPPPLRGGGEGRGGKNPTAPHPRPRGEPPSPPLRHQRVEPPLQPPDAI